MKKPWVITPRTDGPVRYYLNDHETYTVEEMIDGKWVVVGELDDLDDFYQMYFYIDGQVFDYPAIHNGKWVRTKYDRNR